VSDVGRGTLPKVEDDYQDDSKDQIAAITASLYCNRRVGLCSLSITAATPPTTAPTTDRHHGNIEIKKDPTQQQKI